MVSTKPQLNDSIVGGGNISLQQREILLRQQQATPKIGQMGISNNKMSSRMLSVIESTNEENINFGSGLSFWNDDSQFDLGFNGRAGDTSIAIN